MASAITKGYILNVSSNTDVYARGEKYYRDGKVLSIKNQEEAEGRKIVKGSLEGNYKNYDVPLRIEPTGALKQYVCSCESYNIWRGACKHVVAVLFSLKEGRTNFIDPVAQEQNARSLADTLEKFIFQDIDENFMLNGRQPAEPVRLVPCFHYDKKGEANLTFTVGQAKKYIIKSIPGFIANVKRGETISYGNGIKFNHSRVMFDDESKKLLDFIFYEEALYTEINKRMNKQYRYMQNVRTNNRSLPLCERSLDTFFDMYEGKEIDGDIEGPLRLQLTNEMPDINVHIRHMPKSTAIIAGEFNFRVVYGQNWHYLISSTAIHRLTQNDANILVHLLKAFQASADQIINFAGPEQDRFLSVVMPKFSKLGIVKSVEGAETISQPDELLIKMYFDSAGKDISCHLIFQYGNIEITSFNEQNDEVLRDAAGEYYAIKRLTKIGFTADEKKKLFILSDNDLMYAFINGSYENGLWVKPEIESLNDAGEVYVSEEIKGKTIKPFAPTLGIRLSGSLLDINMEDSGYSFHELYEVLEAYRVKKKYHRLKDGRFFPLQTESIAVVADILSAMDISRKDIRANSITIPAYRALYLNELTKGDQTKIKRNSNYQMLIEEFHDNEARTFDVPKSLDKVLREYQKTGYQWLKTLARYGFGGILADDMGLGKTIQIISVILSDRRDSVKSLVVAPTSLIYNWEHEIKRFAPSLQTKVIAGLPEKRRELLHSKADVYITTYDTMKRDIAAYKELSYDYLIADEAQNIKNPSTQNARAIKEIQAKIKYALTGTPIENTLHELWSIFDFIMPGYLYSAHKFSRLYETPIVKDNDASRATKLRKQIEPFVLRRVKKNVLKELPDKTETILRADLTEEQRKIYIANLLIARDELEKLSESGKAEDNRIRILAQLTRLRQICCHPSLFVENYDGGSGKLDLTMQTIQRVIESNHRLLLFSQFTTMLDILKKTLDGSEYSYFYLDGATKAQERMELTKRFNAGEGDLFLISLKAGGTGLNLTGADMVIHFDPWWNPSVMDQASDRAHRYGQTKAVQIYNIVAKDTIEEKIMELQDKKRNLIDSVITEGGSFVSALTEEELRELFS